MVEDVLVVLEDIMDFDWTRFVSDYLLDAGYTSW